MVRAKSPRSFVQIRIHASTLPIQMCVPVYDFRYKTAEHINADPVSIDPATLFKSSKISFRAEDP